MKLKKIVLTLGLIAFSSSISAQHDKFSYNNGRHEFRLAASDGSTLANSTFLGIGLSDDLTGTRRTDEQSYGVYGIGYRYGISRFRVGFDVGFSKISSKLVSNSKEAQALVKQRQTNIMVLPAAEMVYYKKGVVELYGSAAVGVNVCRATDKALSEAGKALAQEPRTTTDVAWQVNPIALRIGNDSIGGFAEIGLGYKGFATVGLSLCL